MAQLFKCIIQILRVLMISHVEVPLILIDSCTQKVILSNICYMFELFGNLLYNNALTHVQV